MKSMFRIAISATLVVSAAVSALPFFGRSDSPEIPVAEAREVQIVKRTSVEIATSNHIIVPGETLTSISRDLLGDMDLFPLIYEQNSAEIETAAAVRGFESSESGHWIFPGESLSISIPVVSEELVEVETAEETEQVSPTQTPELTGTATATTTVATETATATPSVTGTETVEPTSTPTAVETATATVTSTSTMTATATWTPEITATPEPTPLVFPFSPVWPLRPESGGTFGISSYYGPSHPLGIDIDSCGGCEGFPIFPVEDGKVIFSGWDAGSGYGNSVIIQHRNGLLTRYAHLRERPLVVVGAQVNQCQALGHMGSTGYSTGPHLHLEVLEGGVRKNPLNYLDLRQLNGPGPDCTARLAAALVELDRLRKEKEQAEFELALHQIDAVRQIAIWTEAVRKAQEELLIAHFLLFPWYQRTVVEPAEQARDQALVPTGEIFPMGKQAYLPFLTEVAFSYGADLDRMIVVMDRCENHSWDPYAVEEDDGGSPTKGLARFKEATYKSNARAMGLSAAEIEDWTNPYNQLRVMAWMYADGSAGAWSGYRHLYMEDRPWLCPY